MNSRVAHLKMYLSKAMQDGPRTLPRKVKTAASIVRARGLSGVMDVISPPAPAPVSGVPQSMRHVARALKSPPANEQEEIEILNNAILSRLKRAHLPKCSPKSLTIIVPFYHTKTEWADDLISSLNRQTDHDFEFIAVFDGSQPGLEAYVTQAVRGAYRFQSYRA